MDGLKHIHYTRRHAPADVIANTSLRDRSRRLRCRRRILKSSGTRLECKEHLVSPKVHLLSHIVAVKSETQNPLIVKRWARSHILGHFHSAGFVLESYHLCSKVCHLGKSDGKKMRKPCEYYLLPRPICRMAPLVLHRLWFRGFWRREKANNQKTGAHDSSWNCTCCDPHQSLERSVMSQYKKMEWKQRIRRSPFGLYNQ